MGLAVPGAEEGIISPPLGRAFSMWKRQWGLWEYGDLLILTGLMNRELMRARGCAVLTDLCRLREREREGECGGDRECVRGCKWTLRKELMRARVMKRWGERNFESYRMMRDVHRLLDLHCSAVRSGLEYYKTRARGELEKRNSNRRDSRRRDREAEGREKQSWLTSKESPNLNMALA
jgi:hypothetical protein